MIRRMTTRKNVDPPEVETVREVQVEMIAAVVVKRGSIVVVKVGNGGDVVEATVVAAAGAVEEVMMTP